MIWDILERGALEAAPALLGCTLRHETPEGTVAGTIIETEAYTQDDPASHAFRGATPRSAAMFGKSGFLYAYFSYGMHTCINVVCAGEGRGEGVLIRALTITEGKELAQARRGTVPEKILANGPGKLTQALGVGLSMNGHDLRQAPLRLIEGAPLPFVATPRVGISQAKDVLWRFVAA